MVGRTVALIAISSLIFLVPAIHGNAYGSIITSENGLNPNQIHRYYTTASLINNQSSNEEIMMVLKSQLQDSDPFKSRISNNEGNAPNLSSTNDVGPFDRHSNDENSDVVGSNEDKGCEFDCVESTSMRDNVPFELPSIPFP
jgi:hypothetical protein